ncbi:hypothetical protein ACVWYF_000916, partial [Hymenobacter sp. UYAg731]
RVGRRQPFTKENPPVDAFTSTRGRIFAVPHRLMTILNISFGEAILL